MKYQIKVKAETINTIYGSNTFYYPMYREKVRPIFQWLIPFQYYLFFHNGEFRYVKFNSLSNALEFAWEFDTSITLAAWNRRINWACVSAVSKEPGFLKAIKKAIKEELEEDLEYMKHLNKIIKV